MGRQCLTCTHPLQATASLQPSPHWLPLPHRCGWGPYGQGQQRPEWSRWAPELVVHEQVQDGVSGQLQDAHRQAHGCRHSFAPGLHPLEVRLRSAQNCKSEHTQAVQVLVRVSGSVCRPPAPLAAAEALRILLKRLNTMLLGSLAANPPCLFVQSALNFAEVPMYGTAQRFVPP